jgi:hypothetical protein
LKPYVIRQGDHLRSLAYQLGFDADAVWSDPKNADLKQLRPNPNILLPGDVLYVPDGDDPTHDLVTGATNSFVSDAPVAGVTITFTDAAFASQPYTIQELPNLTGLTSDSSGTVTFSAPVTLDTATVVFAGIAGATYPLKIGHLDPIETPSGIFQRLRNLGFVAPDEPFDPDDLDSLRRHLRELKAAQSGGTGEPEDSAPPSGQAPTADDAGLSADGKLDASTSAMLLQAHKI